MYTRTDVLTIQYTHTHTHTHIYIYIYIYIYTMARLISDVIMLWPGVGKHRLMLSVTKLKKDMGNRTSLYSLFFRFYVRCI
jgi:hypothetical protein